ASRHSPIGRRPAVKYKSQVATGIVARRDRSARRRPSRVSKRDRVMGTVVHAVGRVAVVATVIASGILTLTGIGAVSTVVATHMANLPALPPQVLDPLEQVRASIGMPWERILAILGAALQIACGLLIAVGTLVRTSAVLLVIYAVLTAYFLHNF